MKADNSMGLVGAAGASRSFLARMPALLAHLGPVKGNSPQSARKAVAGLRAGYAVTHYSALEACSAIWVCVPEEAIDATLRDLAAQTPIHRTIVVLCDAVRSSARDNPLSKTGARLATLNLAPGTRETVFFAEGDTAAVQFLRRLMAKDGKRLVVLPPESKELYFLGEIAASRLIVPWLDAGVRLFRHAGFSRADAIDLAKALTRRALKEYENTGLKLGRDLAHLPVNPDWIAARDPELAELFRQGVRLALAHRSKAIAARSAAT